jgi:autotransporter-associated beta strand protein
MEGDDSCVIDFRDNSSAGYANITIKASPGNLSSGQGYFYDGATADHATLVVNGATTQSGSGAFLVLGVAAADATVIVQGGSEHNAGGGATYLTTTTGNATIIVNGGSNGGLGGYCNVDATNGAARMEIFGNGSLDGSGPVGSIEGDGLITGDFTVGSNNLSTTFSGVISGNTLTKVGTGTLTLAGASTYTTRTTVLFGTLLVSNRKGSGTGSGPVFVYAGALGGRGIISGAVTIGGEGSASSLAPSTENNKTMTLTIQDALTLTADATYVCKVNLQHASADKVTANGVTINPAAIFSLLPAKHGTLAIGTKFTVINNTSANPINSTFANLSDGSVLSAGGNNFQASYEGGDGNDLTLQVVP